MSTSYLYLCFFSAFHCVIPNYLITSICNLSSLYHIIARALSWFLGNATLRNAKTALKAKAPFTADHTQTKLKTRCLKCVYLIASFSAHTFIVCFHFLSSIFGQVSCDFWNSCSASLSWCISVTYKPNFYVKLRYIYLYSYRYFQILFGLFSKSVQASGSFLCTTAPPEPGQTEDNQSEVWSVFVRWSRKQGLRRGALAKTKRGIF